MAQHDRPLIGINADFVPASKTAEAHVRLNAGYFDQVLAAGGLPVLLPPVGKVVDPDLLLDRLDGVVFSGAPGSLDPRRNGQTPHPSVRPIAERREESDRLFLRRAAERQLPVLAIGLGMQHLNVVCGGSLYTYLPEDMPRSLPHQDRTGETHRHAIVVEPGTRLDGIYGAGEVLVNSAHQQAVRQVGTGLRVSARAPDGVIEAIEADDPDWFCVGVQWHPESVTASALDLQLFEAFLQACAAASRLSAGSGAVRNGNVPGAAGRKPAGAAAA